MFPVVQYPVDFASFIKMTRNLYYLYEEEKYCTLSIWTDRYVLSERKVSLEGIRLEYIGKFNKSKIVKFTSFRLWMEQYS